jgi:hypothetical protein
MDSAKRRSRAPFVTWFTCSFEHIDHAIGEDDMATGLSVGTGRYAALCGATVCVASMICPPGRRCSSCEAAVLGDQYDLPSPGAGFFARLRARGRHRDDSMTPQPGVGYRLFGWRKRIGVLRSRGSRGD